MSLFTDILKGLPENAVLRGKVADAEERYAALETENAILKDDLRDAKAEIAKLKKQVEEFTHKDDLAEIDLKLLVLIAEPAAHTAADLADALSLHIERVAHHLDKLLKSDYLSGFPDLYGATMVSLKQKGREALLERNLI